MRKANKGFRNKDPRFLVKARSLKKKLRALFIKESKGKKNLRP